MDLTTKAALSLRAPRHRILARCLAVLLLAGYFTVTSRAETSDDKTSDERGRVLQRDYVFDAADHKRMTYALYVPTTYVATHPAPLIVLLHGWASNPWQVIHYMGIVQEAEKRGYIVVAPYGYNEFGGYGNGGPGRNGWLFHAAAAGSPPNLSALSEQDVFNVLALVRAAYAINPQRLYLMGHSMGGGGALYLGLKYKGQWAALAALSPAIYSNPEALATIRDTPIIMVQGELDVLVKAENTRRWVDEMKKLKMDYEYLEIPGGDHIFSILTNPGMIAQVFDFFDRHSR